MKSVIKYSLIAFFAIFLISSATPPQIETLTPTVPPTATPVSTVSPTPPPPAINNIFPTVTFIQMLMAFFGCAALLTAFGKIFIDLRVIKPSGFNIACILLVLLFGLILVRGSADFSYYCLGGALIFAVLLANVLVNYVLKNLVLTSPEKVSSFIDNTKLKFKVMSLENQIKKNAAKKKVLEGRLLQAKSKQQMSEANFTNEQGKRLALQGTIEAVKTNYDVANIDNSRLAEENEQLRLEVGKKIRELDYTKDRSNKLAEVDNAIAGIHLFLWTGQDIIEGIKNSCTNFVVKKIREGLFNYLRDKSLDDFIPTVSIFMVSPKENNRFGFEVLATSDMNQVHVNTVQNDFYWDTSKPGDVGTKGIASRCIKSQAPHIFIPDLQNIPQKDKRIWVPVMDDEMQGMLICVSVVMKHNVNGVEKKEVLGVINVTAPTKEHGTNNAIPADIGQIVVEIVAIVLNYVPNVCSFIYLFKYAKSHLG